MQAFRLAPDTALLHFVRAEWRVGQRQGFAASVWLRGEQRLEIVKSDVKPASWVLFAQGGYESMAITLLELSPGGFEPTGIGFSCGC